MQFANFARSQYRDNMQKDSINYAYLAGTESNGAKLPFRAVCKFAFGGIDLRIYSSFFLPFALFNMRPFGVASFFPGGPLDVHRAFSPLLQPLARGDWRWGFRLR